jgi:hypothetical protein
MGFEPFPPGIGIVIPPDCPCPVRDMGSGIGIDRAPALGAVSLVAGICIDEALGCWGPLGACMRMGICGDRGAGTEDDPVVCASTGRDAIAPAIRIE